MVAPTFESFSRFSGTNHEKTMDAQSNSVSEGEIYSPCFIIKIFDKNYFGYLFFRRFVT